MPGRVGPHIGELRRRVTIMQPQVVSGKQNWVDLMTVWAGFEQQTGVEAAAGAANPTNIQTTVVRIRYQSGIRARMRLRYQNRILEILSVIDPSETHRELHLVVKEATS